jgi:hypothetical protein
LFIYSGSGLLSVMVVASKLTVTVWDFVDLIFERFCRTRYIHQLILHVPLGIWVFLDLWNAVNIRNFDVYFARLNVLRVCSLLLPTLFQLEFRTTLTVWYFLLCILLIFL